MGLFRRRPPTDALPGDWRDILDSRIVAWQYLTDDERDLLGDLSGRLILHKNWEAARGFELTDEMQLLIAAQAALLILGLDFEYYHAVGAIIVHPTTMVLRGPRGAAVEGLMTDGPMPILGEAMHRGPIVIAWDAVRNDAHHPERGHNVVFHEFAHKLDMADDIIDGTPPMPREELDRWVEVCTREYEIAQHQHDSFLSSYAGVNPGEFFAVATEAFFDRSTQLREARPELYEVLAGFYRQDPAARVRQVTTD